MSAAFTAYEIPLQPTPQTLTVTLVGVQYQFTVKWNEPNLSWVLDIADSNSVAIVNGIPLVTGEDLLGQLGYLDIGGSLYAQTDNDTNAVPTFVNLGTQGHLYFVVYS